MDVLLDMLQFGIPYAILALGVFISYRILDFADMTCEGSFVFGGAIAIMLISNGVNAWIATLIAIIGGIFAGLITGLLHTKLKVNGLLSGIITMTGLFSINMVILGISFTDAFSFSDTYNSFKTLTITATSDPTIFGLLSNAFALRKYGLIVELIIIALIVYLSMYFFFGTEVGMSMRACGMNRKMSQAQGINTNFYVILGLCISNGLIALAGALAAQRDCTVSTTSGTGMLVIGLASIIIGESLFGKRNFKNWLISIAAGALIYYLIIALALRVGFPNHLLKLLYAIIIVIILALGFINSKTQKDISVNALFKNLKNKFFKKKEEVLEQELSDNFDVLEPSNENSELHIKDNTILSVNNVVKKFNRTGNIEDLKIALNDISVDIKEGEFVTIIGGNGSGKSTFFNTVSGVYKPEQGSIVINGVDVTKQKEYQRAKYIGRVAQDPYQGTAHDMSIIENMNLALRRDRKKTLKWGFSKKDEQMLKDKLKTLGLGLENRMTTKIGTLSGGQRQAVTLLMATLKRPDILFLDEHTAALDPKTAKKVLNLTDSIVKTNNLTCVMVTHNMKDAIKYGNRLLMFNNGKIIYDVSGEEKANLTVEDLLKKFDNVDFNDSNVLG